MIVAITGNRNVTDTDRVTITRVMRCELRFAPTSAATSPAVPKHLPRRRFGESYTQSSQGYCVAIA